MSYEPIEEKRVYLRAEQVADEIWEIVMTWEEFARRNVGGQLVRAADSIGANIAEAGGRFHPNDVKNFLYHSRGSLRETKFFLRRALQRHLIATEVFQRLNDELENLSKELNGQIRHQKERARQQ
ncbi:MAG TPA: four helix bundle protein [Abditibacteriaceae bacterium]|jgi:four helix bundle protein